MVTQERQAAAGRAEWAYLGEKHLAILLALAVGINAGIGNIPVSFALVPPLLIALGINLRADNNKKRVENLRNPQIPDDDQRARLFRNRAYQGLYNITHRRNSK